jgi:hypothetical protein
MALVLPLLILAGAGVIQFSLWMHALWEALARLHERRNDLLGLEASIRRLRSALVELGEGDDPERVIVPPALERVFTEVRTVLLRDRAA